MALKDRIPFGMSLPHRSPDTIDMRAVHAVAQRAEALGFRDLWVTENTLDHVTCFDPVVVLTYAASITTRIGVGASVMVLAIHSPLMVAHQWATLDYVSNGRAILGVGLGREHHYRQFEVPVEARVRRFREEVELIRALWTQQKVTYRGQLLSPGRRQDGAEAGADSAADLDGCRPSRCGPPDGVDRRRMDGVGRIRHRRIRPFGAAAARRVGGGRARSGQLPDLEARSSWRWTSGRRWHAPS